MSFPTYVDLQYGMERLTSSTEAFPLGLRGEMPDGRVYRYCLADSNLLNHWGAANGDPLHESDHDVAVKAGEIGDRSIALVMGTAAKDQYKGGYINTHGTEVMVCLKIKGNDAADTNTVFYLEEPLVEDLPLETFCDIHEMIYHSVIAKAGSKTSVVVMPPVAVTSGDYFWGQTWGPTIGTAGFASGIGAGANERSVYFNTDGSIGAGSDLDPSTGYQYAGYMIHDSAATDDIFFYLQLE